MLINIAHGSPAEHRRLFIAGIIFLVSMITLVGLSIAIYDKAFTSKTLVTLEANRAGTQLSRFGDVRMHGALVGYVDKVASDGERARITLALRPAAARNIPAGISAQILPTTLFGQNYVELIPPTSGSSNGSANSVRDGQVIPSDRVTTNVELQRILADLYPVLKSVNPADLNATLYALAHAFQGKGDQMGDTLVEFGNYLDTMNGHLPELRADMRLLSTVATDYNRAAPDIIRLLRNATVTGRTIHNRRSDLEGSLEGLTGVAEAGRVTLAENKKRIIAQARSGRPLMKLLATYSPEVPCLLTGLDHQRANTKNVFRPDRIHQTLELGAPQRTAYGPDDVPVYGEVGHGPWCLGLPDDYEVPAPFLPLKEGTEKDNPDGGLG